MAQRHNNRTWWYGLIPCPAPPSSPRLHLATPYPRSLQAGSYLGRSLGRTGGNAAPGHGTDLDQD